MTHLLPGFAVQSALRSTLEAVSICPMNPVEPVQPAALGGSFTAHPGGQYQLTLTLGTQGTELLHPDPGRRARAARGVQAAALGALRAVSGNVDAVDVRSDQRQATLRVTLRTSPEGIHRGVNVSGEGVQLLRTVTGDLTLLYVYRDGVFCGYFAFGRQVVPDEVFGSRAKFTREVWPEPGVDRAWLMNLGLDVMLDLHAPVKA